MHQNWPTHKRLHFMKSFKISNFVTKILLSSEKINKRWQEGGEVLIKARGGGSEIFSKKKMAFIWFIRWRLFGPNSTTFLLRPFFTLISL